MDKLKLFLDWVIEQNYSECRIVIGDYLHRFNEYISFGKDIDEAEEKTQLLGRLVDDYFQTALKEYPKDRFSVFHWKDMTIKHPRFDTVHKRMLKEFQSNQKFQAAIESCSTSFVNKQVRKGWLFLDPQKAIEKSNDYILEELTVFSLLIEDGYQTKIYLGTILEVLKKIALEQFPEFKTNLSEGIYIELKIKKRE